ncbi:MAG: site-2 protease family protein [Ignavibacteria bacterium]|nr:site-2 protease family protein [Ignavibacteria bacterium]
MSIVNSVIFGFAFTLAVIIYNVGILLSAKLFKIKIEKFYIFFDSFNKRFTKFYINNCEVGLGVFPTGGYVKLAGMDSDRGTLLDESQKFNSKTRNQKFLVTFSGIMLSMLLLIISISLINTYNLIVDNVDYYLSSLVLFAEYLLNDLSSNSFHAEWLSLTNKNSSPALLCSVLLTFFILVNIPLNLLSIAKSNRKKIILQNIIFIITFPTYVYITIKILLLFYNVFGLGTLLTTLLIWVLSCYACGFIFYYLFKVCFQFILLEKEKSLKAFVRTHFDRGLELEESEMYIDASKSYMHCINKKTKKPILLQTISLCRYLICQIKAGNIPDTADIDKFLFSYKLDPPSLKPFLYDLMYRYVYLLIDNYYLNEAGNYIHNYLDDTKIEVNILIKYLIAFKRNKLIEVISDINKYISNIANLNTDDIRQLQSVILSNEQVLNENDKIAAQINDTKDYIFNKLLVKSISEGKFEECLEEITKVEDFIEDPLLLKNAGICCIRMAMNGELNENNYEAIISLWLTSIYSDKVILKVLEIATWDDDYSFTFNDSIGSNYKFRLKLENVNYEPVNEYNISIGSVQKSLLSQFENYLNKITPNSLHDKIETFYQLEKAALTKLVEIMSHNIALTTPTLAKKYKIVNKILDYLEIIYKEKQYESILELGSKYIELEITKDSGVVLKVNSDFEKYASSLWYEDLLIGHIKSLKINNIKKETYQSVICRFNSIKNDFEEKAINELNQHIRNNEDQELILDLLEKIIEIVPSSNDLRYLYSENANIYIVEDLNNNNITNLDALFCLFKAVFICPEHQSSAKNFSYIVKSNITDDHFRDMVKTLMPKLKSIACKNLYNTFYNEYAPLVSELRNKIDRPRIDITKLMDCIKVLQSLINSANIYKNEKVPI